MVSVEHLALCPVLFTVNPLLSPPGDLFISSPWVWGGGGLKGQVHGLSACSLIKLPLSNSLLILSLNNLTHMYRSDLRVYFKVELYSEWPEVGWRSTKIAEKISGLCQHYQRLIYCWPEGLFHGWLIYSYFQIFKLIMCKWLPGECADWFFDIIMTWSYCLHRRYSMSRQKNSSLINEHALNREPVL